jgi:predicted lipoprotein with Yx(FWY)xxD motif
VTKDANLGDILVDGKGMTLYLFTKDQANVTNCYDQCAVSWPPLLVAAGKEAAAGQGVTGKLSVIDRKDGTRQVVYNGWPLYYFIKDTKAGDTTGQNVGKVWFIVHPTDDAAAGVPAAAAPAAAEVTPSVKVADQPIAGDAVTIAEVSSKGPGWIVVHADKNGAPGPVLGYTAVKDGANKDVVVKLAAEGRTETLYAMLHVDVGTVGTYEFPGADIPATVNGAVVTPAFKATAAAPATLPTTGGVVMPWASILLLAAGGVVLLGGLGLAVASRKR